VCVRVHSVSSYEMYTYIIISWYMDNIYIKWYRIAKQRRPYIFITIRYVSGVGGMFGCCTRVFWCKFRQDAVVRTLCEAHSTIRLQTPSIPYSRRTWYDRTQGIYTYMHTHTHTHIKYIIYIYCTKNVQGWRDDGMAPIYIYMCVCMCANAEGWFTGRTPCGSAVRVNKTEMSYPCGSFLSIFPWTGKMYAVRRRLIGDMAETQMVCGRERIRAPRGMMLVSGKSPAALNRI